MYLNALGKLAQNNFERQMFLFISNIPLCHCPKQYYGRRKKIFKVYHILDFNMLLFVSVVEPIFEEFLSHQMNDKRKNFSHWSMRKNFNVRSKFWTPIIGQFYAT